MKIALIYLPHPWLTQPDAQIPIGLLYLAQILEDANVACDVLNFSSYTTEKAIEILDEYDIYGITVTSLELLQANRFAKSIKEKYPASQILLGGPGTITPEFIDPKVIDKICVGDGEKNILTMLKGPLGIYRTKPIKNLDEIPYPARYKLTNLGGNIFAYNKQYQGDKSTVLLTSRGCPFDCAFCSSPYICRQYQQRSLKNVVGEIEDIITKYHIHQIRISDDMFTVNEKRVQRFCQAVKDLNISWRISTRVKPFTEKLAKNLVDGGCKEISFGVESFDDDVLQLLKKKTTAEDNSKAIKIAKDAGLTVRILFMVKTPGQEKKTIQLNIKYLEQLDLYYDIIACTTFIPIPGCDIWYHPEKYNIEITDKNLDNYNFYFFSSGKITNIKNVIRLNGRNEQEVNRETELFRTYLLSTNKINEG